MEIKTINGGIIDTNKLNDINAAVIEKIANSGIREFVIANNGYCFMVAKTPTMDKSFQHLHFNNGKEMEDFVFGIHQLFMHTTNGQYGVYILENKKE